jgi:phytol kinase
MKKELFRKGVHTLLAFGFIFLAQFGNKEVILGFAFCVFIMFVMVRALGVYVHFEGVPRVSYGEMFFALGVVVSIHVAWPHIVLFQIALLVLGLADPFAAIIGMRYGRKTYRVFGEKRSYVGSTACFVVSGIIFLVFNIPVALATGVAVTVTIVEAVSPKGSDNVFMPLVTVLLLQGV